jgi:hypothetical protein
MRNVQRGRAVKTKRTGGERLVRLTNGREYVESVNVTFGIAVTGAKDRALVMTLANAVEIIRDVNKFGGQQLYAELVEGGN